MKRIIRERRLRPEEAAKYKAIREQVSEELPDLIARHHERLAVRDQLQGVLGQLKAARVAKGLSLADLAARTGMDRSALCKLESGQRPNPTLETLVRYAEAVGERLVVSLAVLNSDANQLPECLPTDDRLRPCGIRGSGDEWGTPLDDILLRMLRCELPSYTGRVMYLVTEVETGSHVTLTSPGRKKPSVLPWGNIERVFNRARSGTLLTPSVVGAILEKPQNRHSSMCALILAMLDPNRLHRL